MKLRIWTGKETLAAIHGCKVTDTFDAFSAWLHQQPAGSLQVWAGRWWQVSRESMAFAWDAERCLCHHPIYRSKLGVDPAEHPGFFEYEAWKRATRIYDLWRGIDETAGKWLDDAQGDAA